MTILVMNPGSVPQMREIGSAVAESASPLVYATPFWSHPRAERLIEAVPGVGPRLSRQLARKRLPDELSSHAMPVGTAAELVTLSVGRLTSSSQITNNIVWTRDRLFDRLVARRLRHWAPNVVVGCQGSCLDTFAEAKRLGIATVLHSPIAHHDFLTATLTEQAKRHPALADTMPHALLPPWRVERLAREIELADRVQVLSSFQHRTFVDAGVNADKLVVIPLGVDTSVFRQTDACERDATAFRVLFVGQLTQRKGLAEALAGFAQARDAGWSMHVVGRQVGPMRVWRDILPDFEYQPAMPRSELAAVYRRADAFVFPSSRGGLSDDSA